MRNPPHRQVNVKVGKISVSVDEGVSFAVTQILRAGFRTQYSCQWEGPADKKFPAYINPLCENLTGNKEIDKLPIPTGQQMADCIGLKKGEYRIFNGVIWFKPFILPF